ncbi:precorrin-2 C(20)-methyltransferase [Labrys monachus]|uniref:Precorrin-2/cobalt-factor-2 C20-methyltransferase n=1 Tax=Labrys monachus TaxID=217067 RepID=A0ABU0FD14_9HYPH|nr:precorrin-2 C(20)-methyltransferase [Labrys monachus]MDQ0392499.1 precorrin-2/cobalt-factor-2 C20-methyltransferase [Labrys monachus]
MSARGRLYGVGVGPGDPELMTLKAARLLAAAPVVAYFCKQGQRGHARTIVEGFLAEGVVEEKLAYPMTIEVPAADAAYHAALTGFYDGSAQRLAGHLDAGRDVVVVSEGDPFFYGSFMPIFHRLAPRYETEVVAGVSGMAGCWTRARTPITYGDDVLTVLPATLDREALRHHLERADAAVIMKLGRNFAKVRAVLEELGLASRAVYVERGTMAGERILPLPPADFEGAPYFAILLVPGQGRLL